MEPNQGDKISLFKDLPKNSTKLYLQFTTWKSVRRNNVIAVIQVTKYKRSIRVSIEFNIPRMTLGRYCISKRLPSTSNTSVQTEVEIDCQVILSNSNNDNKLEFDVTATVHKPNAEYMPDNAAIGRDLSRKLDKKPWHKFGYAKRFQVFEPEQEGLLEEYLMKASDIYFGLYPKEVRRFAYTYAVACSWKIPHSWIELQSVGSDWFSGFLKRHPKLSICSPQAQV
ncbi:uncharacterized protein LOC136073784 isoform X4 [Hydra vulgaris]|uniref:Uncharacterized protein LOC136073784 isoform X4 n=1 Tax=Hydra vulgaris TaxID=6087 RepID=A0ABM4DK99_HYDVU